MTWQQILQQVEDIYSANFDADTTKRFFRMVVKQAAYDDGQQVVFDEAVAEQLAEIRGRLDALEKTERSRQATTLWPGG